MVKCIDCVQCIEGVHCIDGVQCIEGVQGLDGVQRIDGAHCAVYTLNSIPDTLINTLLNLIPWIHPVITIS